jgi:hypothetical protein
MTQDTMDRRIVAGKDESYTKPFVVCGEGAQLRKCLICERVFSRQDSFEHSKFPCHPLASTAN